MTGSKLPRVGVVGLAAAIFLADRFLQGFMVRSMVPGQVVPVVPPVLYLTLAENTGAAFSLLQHSAPFLIAVAVAVIGGALAALWRWPHLAGRTLTGLGLVMGGAAGNLWDRLVAGRVIDYVYIRDWPVFNLADGSIVVGMALILWEAWKHEHVGA